MDVKVSFYNDLVDNVSNLPKPHLSFIINLLLPKRLVDNTTADKYFKDVQDVKRDDQVLIKINNMLYGIKNDSQCILVGSNAERFNIPYTSDRTKFFQGKLMSDIDCLLVIEKHMVHSKSSSTSNEKLFTIDNENVHPGYCRLKFTEPTKFEDVKGDLVYIDELQTYYLDGNALQMAIIEEDYKEFDEFFKEIHGPAVSLSVQDVQVHFYDGVIAFKLQKWPVEARSFIERQQRQKWLTSNQVRFIEKNGIHLVQVSHKLSPHPDVEWRYSFAVTEVYITNNVITNQARQCFVFLKLIYVQSLKQLDLLSSYHLKTVFLFSCEQIQQNEWIDNIGSCLLYMIDILIECVKNKFLSSFFIPENNLIDHFNDAESSIVLETLMEIREFPLRPILEFTDEHAVDFCRISISFRDIILPVLEDMVDFLSHLNINRAITNAFRPALFKMVDALSLEGKLKEAICYVIDICQMIDKLSPGCNNVADFVDFIIIGLTTNIREIKAQVFSDIHPDILILKGNIACMFHEAAYGYIIDSEERNLALTQAEDLFYAVADADVSSPAVVDFSLLLIQQRRFDSAADKLDSYIAAAMNQKQTLHCFYEKEAIRLDEVIQKEIANNGKFCVNSLSMACYLLVKCVVKDNLPSAKTAIYKKIFKYFTDHCNRLNESSSFSLLGYAYMIVDDFVKAVEILDKALVTCNGSIKLIEENKEFCKLRLLELKSNKNMCPLS